MSTIFNIDTTGFDNVMRLEFSALSQNEAFARVAVAAFVAQLDPTINEITDIKTAVSEAVTNAIIHGYGNRGDIGGTVYITCGIRGRVIDIYVWDSGTGIADVAEARMPLYTSKPEMERSGMGFTVMETFMDNVFVESQLGDGTLVHMVKEMDD